MDPMHFIDGEKRQLLDIARESIVHGFETGRPRHPRLETLPPALTGLGASFVTLFLRGSLQGCVGVLEATRALALEVAENAFKTAFHDVRFEPLGRAQLEEAHIEISVLTPLEPMRVASRGELLENLRPERDGLVIVQGFAQATFLPKVWRSLPEPEDFVTELMNKGGMRRWTSETRVYRYQAVSFGDADAVATPE